MGPRHFSRGSQPPRALPYGQKDMLQWGHGISAVEVCILSTTVTVFSWASMGPRHFSRGSQSLTTSTCRLRKCFNGATAFQPWKWCVGDVLSVNAQTMLQWGHGISAVEVPTEEQAHIAAVLLQWGHGISAVEVSRVSVSLSQRTEASMGPRHFSRGSPFQHSVEVFHK